MAKTELDTVPERALRMVGQLDEVRATLNELEARVKLLKAEEKELEYTLLPHLLDADEIARLGKKDVVEHEQTVHGTTLRTWARDMLRDGKPLPEMLKVYGPKRAIVKALDAVGDIFAAGDDREDATVAPRVPKPPVATTIVVDAPRERFSEPPNYRDPYQ